MWGVLRRSAACHAMRVWVDAGGACFSPPAVDDRSPQPPHILLHTSIQDITVYGIRAELFDDLNAARGLHEERHMIKWRGEVGGSLGRLRWLGRGCQSGF